MLELMVMLLDLGEQWWTRKGSGGHGSAKNIKAGTANAPIQT